MTETKSDLTIAVIGGGPAGSFSCHFLNKLARERDKRITIDIYDYKQFGCGGRKNCNMGAGIIAATLVQKLEQEGIFLPQSVIKGDISGYQLHSKYNTVYFDRYKEKKIYSVFRGQGPMTRDGNVNNFDQYLLELQGKADNVTIINKKVTAIDCSADGHVAITADNDPPRRYDAVVGAFGVNAAVETMTATGYRPPPTMTFLQFEIVLPADFIRETYKGRVHMFPVYRNNIWFITLTPKGDFVTVTAVGKNVKAGDARNELLKNPNIKNYLPGGRLEIKCGCRPELPVGFSKKPYSRRFLVVGDACVSRYLKNGIESAWETAFFAADTIINHDLSETSIKKWYYRRCRQRYGRENLCGALLYKMDRFLYINRIFTETQMILAKKEQLGRLPLRFSEVLWDMFTGHKSYITIFKNAFHPRLLLSMCREFFLGLARFLARGRAALRFPLSKFHRLLNHGKVAIIGGGPAGVACAVKLARLTREKNLDIEIVLYEPKDFQRHHNQCVGILSPPLLETLEKELDIKIPRHIIRSRVPGYQLHTEKESIFLQSDRPEKKPTYSVRRSEFDAFLLEQARAQGVRVVNSRVTDLEFCRDTYHDEVRIFSESDFLKADVVVCAFGLDSEMTRRLSEATNGRYRGPSRLMKTFLTRLDFPDGQPVETDDRRVHAFLLSSLKRATFGAVTVKDDHVVVNLAGENIGSLHLRDFMRMKGVSDLLPDTPWDKMNCYCGRFPSSPARRPYGDRYVTVGDTTGWLRPLKGKGINLAVITGINAARVMVEVGFSRRDFSKYRRLCKEFIRDYKFGFLVRLGMKPMLKSGLMDYIIRKARTNPRFYRMLYNAVSAEKSYREIFQDLFRRQKPSKTRNIDN